MKKGRAIFDPALLNQGRSDPKNALPVKASICHQDMAVRVEPEEVAKGLDGDNCTGDGISLRHRLFNYVTVLFRNGKTVSR
jgi:hypothetical protein